MKYSWWAFLGGHLFVGAVAAAVLFVIQYGPMQPTPHLVVEWVSHAFVVAFLTSFAHAAQVFDRMADKLTTLEHKIDEVSNDERIILARTEPLPGRREVSIIGVERLDETQIPAPLERPAENEQWEVTISLLRFDRFQDLLFSTDYLQHFLRLHAATKRQYRVVIINDHPRPGSEAAIRSFLQMSHTLGITSHLYLKSEFYEMCTHLMTVKRRVKTKGRAVRAIMEGQPELSLMRPDPDTTPPPPLTPTDTYKLRYRTDRIHDVGPTDILDVPLTQVDAVYALLRLAISDSSRIGLSGLSAVLGKSCSNHLSQANVKRIVER